MQALDLSLLNAHPQTPHLNLSYNRPMTKKETHSTDKTPATAPVPETATTPAPTPAPQVTTEASSSIPVIALVLGIVSLTMFIWPLGIPAIILGIIGLKKYKENRGLSITGIVTGAISTFLMIASLIFVLFIIITAAVEFDNIQNGIYPDDSSEQHRDSNRGDWHRPSFEVM